MKHFQASARRFCRLFAITALSITLAGCGKLHHKPGADYVYVSVKETFLRDRVAAVSNRVADVSNGERLQVLQHDRRFLQVKTGKGAVGWLEEHYVITQPEYDQFAALESEHAHDPVIATAVLQDDSYAHVAPGRKTEHFYLLPENDKLQLLVRASVPRPLPPGMPLPQPKKVAAKLEKDKTEPDVPEGPPMEDYWLVRDAAGRTGWVRARALDVNVPDALAGVAETERMVGAYVLRTVSDPESSFPNGQAPEYLAVLSPFRDGLPYDFDSIRVFTWNTKKHRYETAYRERDVEGFLPVTVSSGSFDKQTEPVFSFRVSDDPNLALDPATGRVRPGQTETQSFRMEGSLVKKIGPETASPATRPAEKTRVSTARREVRRHHRREKRRR